MQVKALQHHVRIQEVPVRRDDDIDGYSQT